MRGRQRQSAARTKDVGYFDPFWGVKVSHVMPEARGAGRGARGAGRGAWGAKPGALGTGPVGRGRVGGPGGPGGTPGAGGAPVGTGSPRSGATSAETTMAGGRGFAAAAGHQCVSWV